MNFFRCFALALTLLSAFMVGGHACAQDASAEIAVDTSTISTDDTAALRGRIDTLPEAERAAARTRLDAVEARLRTVEDTRTDARGFSELAASTDENRERLKADIERVRDQPPVDKVDVDTMDNGRLRQLQDELRAAEDELSRLRTSVAEANADIQSFAARTADIPVEIDQARNRLAAVERQLDALPDVPETFEESVRLSELQSRRALQQARIEALTTERNTIPQRREILDLTREQGNLLIQRLVRRVESLQAVTGQRLRNEADDLERRNRAAVAGASTAQGGLHPLIAEFAERNAELVARLDAIAESEISLPRRTAQAQEALNAVTNNLSITTQLTELGDLDRRAGETLRRLRTTVPVLPAIESDMEVTRAQIIEAGQDSLLADQEKSQLPFRRTDLSPLLEEFRRTNPDVRDLSDTDTAWLAELYDLRRVTLERISTAATSQRESAASLQVVQGRLLEDATELKTTLDESLLWLPSAEPIFSTAWPGKVVRGTIDLLSGQRIGAIAGAALDQTRRFLFWPAAVLMLVVAAAVFARRGALRASIVERGGVVGKVREDSYFTTPIVALEGALIATPLPLLIAFAGWVLDSAESVLPIVRSAGSALLAVSLFLWAVLTLRVWCNKGGLFDRHIPIPEDLRRGIQVETRWLLPVGATAMGIAELTHVSRDVDIYEGVSVPAFIVLCVALAFFSYRLLLGRKGAFARHPEPGTSLAKWRNVLVSLLIGVPALAGLAAAFGYFATAEEVIARMLRSVGLATVTFVVFGIVKRAVNIANRRLSLKHVLEKREAAQAERRRQAEAKAEALVDGEEPNVDAPPPVDYEQIDLEQSSRQTRELIGTVVLIGFAVLMWMIWRELLPALGALESVELYRNGELTVGEGEDATTVTQFITLWDIIQAIVTVGLTVLAAKNLPGFLEVFVLNRSSMDRGLKYAITTILGYVIVAFGIVTALNQLGVRWGQLGFVVAALGVGIGFGLQEIIANFISGIIILFERPVRVGDYVTVGDQSGTVSRIKIRATTLTDLDNKEILIPNKEFITSRVTNWTLSNSILRIIIPVGIAYGSDTKAAQKIMLDVLNSEPKVLDKPAPQAIFVNFGDSSLDFELRVFIRSFEDRFPVINSVHTAINLALEEAGIGIPFPQRDLHLVSADAGLQVTQGSTKGRLPAMGADPGLAAE